MPRDRERWCSITRSPSGRKGSAIIETVLFLPILILLMMGTIELARFIYTYFTLEKILFSMARYVSTQQGVDFCDAADPTVIAGKYLAITGTTDGTGTPIISGLTPDMLSVQIESVDPTSGALSTCSCSVPGCDTENGGLPPDFIVVTIPGGYPVTPRIPLIPMDAIPLVPQVRVPNEGT